MLTYIIIASSDIIVIPDKATPHGPHGDKDSVEGAYHFITRSYRYGRTF